VSLLDLPLKGEAVEARRRQEGQAIDQLKQVVRERYVAGDLLSATEATAILVSAGLRRKSARKVRDRGIGVHWSRSGDGGKASGSKAAFIPINAANLANSENHTGTTTLSTQKFAVPDRGVRQTSMFTKPYGENGFKHQKSLPSSGSNGSPQMNGSEASSQPLVEEF
jgi:hypothetical protein